MTPREKEIIELLKENPRISQQEIAEKLNITRSGVSTHINNLVKRGYVLGRGYILREEDYVNVIGGANMDVVGKSFKKILIKDSNPGTIHFSSGGVGRNIAEDMARLSVPINFITIIGDDFSGELILQELKELSINIDNILKVRGRTPHYLAILNEENDMEIAISDMEILKYLDENFLQSKKQIIERAKFNVLDTNLTEKSLEYLFKNIDGKYLVDGVSTKKVIKIKDYLENIYFLKVNEYEAEILSDKSGSVENIGRDLINKGLNSLCITMGNKGSYYFSRDREIYKKAKYVEVKSASGAGDAFMAGFATGLYNDYDVNTSLDMAIAASRIVLESESTSSDNLNIKNLEVEKC